MSEAIFRVSLFSSHVKKPFSVGPRGPEAPGPPLGLVQGLHLLQLRIGNAEIDIQELTNKYVSKIDQILAVKEKEILTV